LFRWALGLGFREGRGRLGITAAPQGRDETSAMLVLLFDIDGTLIHTQGAGRRALEMAVREAFSLDEPVADVPLHGRTDRAIVFDLFTRHGIDSSEENWARLKQAYLSHLPRLLQAGSGEVLPGIRSLLEELRTRDDVRLGLLTGNNAAGARIKLGHFDLDHFFAFGGYGDLHQDRNDVAWVALREVERCVGRQVDLQKVWVIGDTPADVACGRAIGARVLAVATGQHSLAELQQTTPDLALSNLADSSPWRAMWQH